MIIDAFTLLSGAISSAGVISGQDLTGQAGGATPLGVNTLDGSTLSIGGNQVRDLGIGEAFYVQFSTLTALAAAGAATVTFQIVHADDAALSTNIEIISQTGALAKASLTQGTNISIRWPPNHALSTRRYYGVRYAVTSASGNLTAGAWVASIVKDPQGEQVYGKNGFVVA